MKNVSQRFMWFVFISAVPSILITMIWIVSVGAFPLIEVIQAEPVAVFHAIAVIEGFITGLAINDSELS